MRRRAGLVAAVVLGAALLLLAVTRGPTIYREFVLDNSDPVACEDRLPRDEVARALERNSAVVRRVEALAPGTARIELMGDSPDCPGRAALLITYPSHANRKEIERLLQGTELERVPAEWWNV